MFHGFYNLTSGVLTQNRNLDVISNNMVNVSTPGYKADKLTMSTFQEEMLYRTGNKDKSNPVQLMETAMIKTPMQTVTRYGQGAFEETGGALDFALSQPGFFVVQAGGQTLYTRNGSFSVDEEGYLTLPGVGRVMGEDGPILMSSDEISVDNMGYIYEGDSEVNGILQTETGEEGERRILGQLRVVDFADYGQLTRLPNGCFTGGGAANPANAGGVVWKNLERSNVDTVEEMTSMMSSQRAMQSATQMLKMYDQLIGKIVSDIGRM